MNREEWNHMVKGLNILNYKRYIVLFVLGALCLAFAVNTMQVSAQDDAMEMFSEEAAPEEVEGEGAQNPVPEDRNFGGGFERDLLIKTRDGRHYNFDIELALTPREQQQGLMFREEMAEMHGMLFVFGSEYVRSFWMKDTLIPLDIIFVEKTGRIQHIHSMAKPLDESLITSGEPSYAVLEINGGMADKLELDAGDYIFHEAFRNTNLE